MPVVLKNVIMQEDIDSNMSKSFEQNIDKQKCRDLLCLAAKKSIGEVSTIVTLPSDKALCVKTFKKHFKNASIIGIERESEIAEVIRKKGITCYTGTVGDYIRKSRCDFGHTDIFFMDYYSHMSQSIMDEVLDLIGNDLIIHPSKPSIIGITLSKAIRHDKGETLAFIKRSLFEDEEVENTVEWVTQGIYNSVMEKYPFLSQFSIEESVEYRTGINMYFILLKIVK